jgi:RecA-family ATPase
MLQHMFFKNFKLSSQTDVALLKDYLKTNEIKLLVLDPFSSVLGASNENDNAEVSKIMDVMRELINELNIGIIFLHHPA